MVKPRPDEALNEGGGNYLSIEKVMKKKKKRKSSPPEDETPNMVASNVDPSLIVRVPLDKRVNVDGVLDQKLQLEVEKWSEIDPSLAGFGSCGSSVGIDGGSVAPHTGNMIALCSKTDVDSHMAGNVKTQAVSKSATISPVARLHISNCSTEAGLVAPQTVNDVQTTPQLGIGTTMGSVVTAANNVDGGNLSQTVPAFPPCLGSDSSSGGSQKVPLAGLSLVFKAGSSGLSSEAKTTGSNVRGPKSVAPVLQRARMAKLRGPDTRLGAGITPKRSNLPTSLPTEPATNVPRAVPDSSSPEGAKVRPKFSEVIKENRIVGNGLKLQQYDFAENDEDIILDENDEIPFVETWGYCLIGCFTGPFPGRQALNSLVKSWNVKCRIIPYANGWTVFRFASDEERFKVFNGGPYLAFGKTLMLKLVDAGVILGDDIFTSVPTWVLFHDVPLSVWSESGLCKISSKVGIPMYTDKVTKDRTKMSYARCLVDVDVSKPPVLEFGVKLSGGRRYIQKVTYECYPDYCCDCKTFGHNVFKCKKNSNDVVTSAVEPTVVLPQVVPPKAPVITSTSVNNNEKPIPPRATRVKTRAMSRNDSLIKESSPMDSTNLSAVNEREDLVGSSSKNGKGLKHSGKDKAVISQNEVVSPNSFDVLKTIGGSNGTQDVDIVDVQMGELVPPSTENARQGNEEGVWKHVSRKGHPNGHGGALSSSVPPCG
ncbi:hypothetical protein LIER_22257 [Lithospermum erythrorhizon]|uniref:DUF4283 domain-containing protein n=1 Tax=Lithospermum erythrorhizon TaxID=34254 RepID=A0AAV3QUC5_LITER